MPLVYTSTSEHIGIIRLEDDNETLYVHDMEDSVSKESTGVYARSIPTNIVSKYAAIPGYFIFHTHPKGIGADPFPSDVDIFSSILHSYNNEYLGSVIISKYGVIIYNMVPERLEAIYSSLGLKRSLNLFTYSYDILMAYNALNSMGPHKLQDKIDIMLKYGIKILVIPSSEYIRDQDEIWSNNIIFGKIIDKKFELLESIRKSIIRIERKLEENNKIDNKNN
jgi:hypothetical protein